MGLFDGLGSSLVGAVVGGGLSLLGGERTNQANSAITQKQMDFQERMRDTSYQSATKDMRKAGLNPILAYQQGGASTPAGASIPAVDSIGKAASSASQSARIGEELEALRLNNEVLKDTSEKLRADTVLADNNSALAMANTRKANADADISGVNAAVANSVLGTGMKYVDTLLPSINSGKSIVDLFTKSSGGNSHIDLSTGEIKKIQGLPVKKR